MSLNIVIAKIDKIFRKVLHRKDLIAISVLVSIIAAFILPSYIQQDFTGDYVWQTVPWYHYLFINLKTGNIPFWTPSALFGFPFLFSPSVAFFHPLTQLALFVDFIVNNSNSIEVTGKIFQYTVAFALSLGGIGMYMLCRKVLNLSRFTGVFVGLAFSLNPFLIHDVHSVFVPWAVNSLPWIFLFLNLFLSKPNFRLYFTVVILNIFIFACGYPYYYVFFIVPQILLALFYGPKKIFLFFVSLLNSILLAGFFLLPYLHIFLSTGRAENVYDFNFHSFASLFPTSIFLILNPLTYSADIFKYPKIASLIQGSSITWGTFLFVFLVYGLFFLKNKPFYKWIVIAFFVTLFYSFGANLSSHSFFGTILPIIYKFRTHARAAAMIIFTGVLLIGIGIEVVSKKQRAIFVDRAMWFIWISVFIAMMLGPLFFLNALADHSEIYRGTAIMLLFLFSSLVVLGLTLKFGKKSFLILGLMIMLLEYHYYFPNVSGYFSNDLTYGQYYKVDSSIPEIPSGNNLFRIYFENRFGANPLLSGAQGVQSYENNIPQAYGNLMGIYGWNPRFWQIANVKYVVTQGDAHEVNKIPELIKINTIDPAAHPDQFPLSDFKTKYYIYELKDYLPRFYIPQRVDPCIGLDCWKKENTPKLVIAKGISNSIINPKKDATVTVISYAANKVELKTATPQVTFIASSETYDDGWTLTINGDKSQFYVVSGGLRGLIVPVGESIVKMTYYPSYFNQGVGLSIIGIVLLIVMKTAYRKRLGIYR